MLTKYQGRDIEVEEVEVGAAKENWNEYHLADGNTLLVKTVLVRVLGAIKEKTETGEPLYMVNSQIILKVRQPK